MQGKRALWRRWRWVLIGVLGLAAGVARGGDAGPLRIGWASADLTPDRPVIITGQFTARLSEGILDPIGATVLAIESTRTAPPAGQVVLVSCDLISIPDDLRDAVRARVSQALPALDTGSIVINATHSHSAPELRTGAETPPDFAPGLDPAWSRWGVAFDAMPPAEYLDFAAGRIAEAVVAAWNARAPGGISFGLSHAVVGHNRLQAYTTGKSRMYGPTDDPTFSHIEGYEDHGVGVLCTWDATTNLTGLILNLAAPSQISEWEYRISADYWHETRLELRRRLGQNLFVLAQCAPAGDQAPRPMVGTRAEARMERLAGRNRRQEIAVRLADAVTAVLPVLSGAVDRDPVVTHRRVDVALSRRIISGADVETAVAEAAVWRERYQQMAKDLDAQPERREQPRWYKDITHAYRQALRGANVQRRWTLQATEPKRTYEMHVLRLGDLALATNPFELYLDYGLQIRERSPAVQTFLVQLAGEGTYVPTPRSVAGGAYGAVPASTEIGPEGGFELVDQTLALLKTLWETTVE